MMSFMAKHCRSSLSSWLIFAIWENLLRTELTDSSAFLQMMLLLKIYRIPSQWKVCYIGLQQYTSVPVHCNIFCHNVNIIRILNKLSRYLQYIYCIHLCINKHGKASCLQLVLTLLPLFSPYARQFSKQTDEKNPCWAVFSVIFKMADTTNACVLPTRLVSCTDFWAHEQDTRQYPSCFVVMYM